jgi:hypothetical protein
MVRSVTIAGNRIPVRYRIIDDGATYGQYLPEEKVIEIDKNLPKRPDVYRATLWHEMVEATLFITGVAWSEKYEQELVVRALENVFYPAWRKVEQRLNKLATPSDTV